MSRLDIYHVYMWPTVANPYAVYSTCILRLLYTTLDLWSALRDYRALIFAVFELCDWLLAHNILVWPRCNYLKTAIFMRALFSGACAIINRPNVFCLNRFISCAAGRHEPFGTQKWSAITWVQSGSRSETQNANLEVSLKCEHESLIASRRSMEAPFEKARCF